jgi:hypothetical protein
MKATCSECQEECNVVVVDEGIGAYEYWGATGVDIKLVAVSTCCEADALDEKGRVIKHWEVPE